VGIWTGILAIVHTAIGLTVHLRGRMWMHFFKQLHPLRFQNTQFGFANFTGLVAALLFLMLLAISNDLSLGTCYLTVNDSRVLFFFPVCSV
jgi:sulfoxide reductase heme-binding subunit YedZ